MVARSLARFVPAALLLLTATVASAQAPRPTAGASSDAQPSTAGWLITPSVVYSTSYDDNVLLHGDGDATEGDMLSVVNPRGLLEYTGRHLHFGADYDGAFLMYHSLDALNSYDQHASAFLEQAVSKHLRLFVRDTAAITPTTASVEFVGVPFVRTGSQINDLRGGIIVDAARHTTLTVAYNAQWVGFNTSPAVGTLVLLGGHSQGGTATLRQQVANRLTLTADYGLQLGTVIGMPTSFNVQNATGGVEYQLSPSTTISGGAGISHTSVSDVNEAQAGPALRAALTRQLKKAGLELAYSRSFVPAYGFGGTLQNEDFTARLHGPLSRKFYGQTSLAWRRNEPLVNGDLKLVSWWYDGAVGYNVRQWMRVEGFYNGVRQAIDRPGGLLNRSRIGVQLVATQPVRMQ